MKLLLSISTLLCLTNVLGQQLAEPTISVESGFYTSDVSISFTHPEPGVTLFYTTNGSDPSPFTSIYSAPFMVSSRNGDSNIYSEIPTNPSYTYPVGDYTESRANNRGWLAPNGEVFKVNIIRVQAYKAGFVPSETVTKTVIVDPSGASIYEMPILSFVMDSIDLFSASTGIYVYGDDANYTQKGAEWERIANMEYFDENGDLAIQQKVRTRIHGGGSRHSTKKTFRVYAEYGDVTNFKYEFFDDYELDKFKRILIKSGGHRPDCFPRDDLANLITDGLHTDRQHFKHVILFLNGEYWGIHSIKERVDNYFFQNQYGIDDDDLSVLDQEYDLQGGGSPQDSLDMVAIETYADTSDMLDYEDYKWIEDRIDMDNYIDYMAAEIFLSNEDWVYSNVVLWKQTGGLDPTKGPGQDGKFRWCLYDLDGAFGGSCANAYYTVNTLNAATTTSALHGPYSRLFRGLLKSDIFKTKWINRTHDLMNSHFKQAVLHDKMDEMYDMLTSEMMENVNRWRYPSEANTLVDRAVETPTLIQWDTTFYYLNRFADRRQRKLREHMMLKWNYPDTSWVELDVNDANMGAVQINTIRINENLPGVNGTVYPWTGIYMDSVESTIIAVPKPGYEFVEWEESGITDDTIYWTTDGDSIFTAIFQPSASYSTIVINEVMPSNSAYMADNFGDYDDWTELYNPNPYPVNISNCTLRRDTLSWTIPEGTVIEPNDYWVVWNDAEVFQGSDHVNFKLPNNTQTVYLYNAEDELMDYMIYPETFSDNSFGRYPNGSGTFSTFSYPTPRENNDIATVDEEISNEFVVYPNPAKNEIWFNTVSDYKLFSLDGKLISQGLAASNIQLNHIQNGTYILQTENGQVTKIVISK
jgi:CotH kinase protein/Lamin Tail Domain/Fn3 associated/Secretion system C-terminal sorting domain/Divergent InlB B-repeat domain